jgi:hypothetical protein
MNQRFGTTKEYEICFEKSGNLSKEILPRKFVGFWNSPQISRSLFGKRLVTFKKRTKVAPQS